MEPIRTVVINFFSGSGAGKSTIAARLYAELKTQDKCVELVREYVKDWAWQNKKVTKYDQAVLFGNQVEREASLYGKVDYLITDSPLLLNPMYEAAYGFPTIVQPAALAFIQSAKSDGIRYVNFVLKRNKPYDPKGRYETEEQARSIDYLVVEKLLAWGEPFYFLDCEDSDRVVSILGHLQQKGML